jgi:hypothetical protein
MSLNQWVRKHDEGGKSLAEILKELRVEPGDANEKFILRRAALPRWFDERDFEKLLAKDITGVSFNKFVKRPDVERAHIPNSFSVRASSRKEILSRWDPKELQQYAAKLVKHFTSRRDFKNEFVCRLYADPSQATAAFLKRYRQADRRFDYQELDDLLCVLRDRQELLAPSLIRALSDREQYFQSRVLYAGDWMRTQSFLERPALFEQFEKFLADRGHWIMNLHAPGGAGKTAFLQWFVSHYAIVERGRSARRIPVAKLDIDSVNLAAIRRWPWLLLGPLAEQLDQQLPNAPLSQVRRSFESVRNLVWRHASADHLYASAESVAATLADGVFERFARGIGGNECLVILDTTEELILHQAPQFQQLLTGFDEVHALCKGFKLIISGRYPLNEAPDAGLFNPVSKQCIFVLVKPFASRESLKYVTRVRGLRNRALARRIARHAGGNPFKLSLFADLAQSPAVLTKEDFQYPEVAYLLHRVIGRIPEEELALRWTLRYAVVPRDLTPEFFDAVLRPHLEREIAKASRKLDDPGRGLPQRSANPWKYVERGIIKRDDLWEALQKYAGPRSWVSFSGDLPRLQPEVVQPMRRLLRQQQIFHSLHTDAISYFERLAAEHPQDWARWTAEAIYHRFQRDGSDAGEYWKQALERPQAVGIAARRTLAELFTSGDFIDDERKPLLDPTGRPLVEDETLALARLELAAAAVRQSRRAKDQNLEEAQLQLAYLKQIEKRMGRNVADSERRAFVEASVADYLGQRDRLTAITQKLKDANPSSSYLPPLLVLEAAHFQSAAPAAKLYAEAYSLSVSQQRPIISPLEIRLRHAHMWFEHGDLALAERMLNDQMKLSQEQGDTAAFNPLASARYEVAVARGDTALIAELLRSGSTALSALNAFRFNAYVQIAKGRADHWLLENDRSLRAEGDEAVVEACLWRTRALCDLFRIQDAYAELESVPAALLEKRPDLAERVTLARVRVALDVIGDIRAARSFLLSEVGISRQLESLLWSLRVGSRTHAAEQWRKVRIQFYLKLPPLRRAEALAHWLAFGRPSVKDWREFLTLCSAIQPVEARYVLLQPFMPYGVRILRSSSMIISYAFPDPPANVDSLGHMLRVSRFSRAAGVQTRAASLIELAFRLAPRDNLILMGRVARAARRTGVVPNQEFVQSVLALVEKTKSSFPELCIIVLLEVTYLFCLLGNKERTSQLMDVVMDLARASEYEFVGRYQFFRLRIERLLRPEPLPSMRSPEPSIYFAPSARLSIRKVRTNIVQTVLKTAGKEPQERVIRSPGELRTTRGQEEFMDVFLSTRHKGEPAYNLPGDADLALDCSEELAGLPWENFVEEPLPRSIFRSLLKTKDPTTRWFQKMLSDLQFATKVDGIWGPKSESDLLLARAKYDLLQTGWPPEAKMLLRNLSKRRSKIAIIKALFEIERSQKRSYGAAGIALERMMRQEFDYEIPRPPITVINHDFVWIVGQFEPWGSEVRLVVVAGASVTPLLFFTPHSLARMIRTPTCSVFLDVPDDPNRVTQCLLRNRFANALYRQGKVRSVLAGGFASEEKLNSYANEVIDAIRQHLWEGKLANQLAGLCHLPPALYTSDPTLPIG